MHDPSVFRDTNGKYYIVGTHLASASSDNLISWSQTDTLRNSLSPETIGKIRAWNKDENTRNWFDYLWAPDIIYNRRMRKYCIYLSANGDDWKSNIVLLTSDKVTGPFEYAGSVVYGGFTPEDWEQTDVPKVLGAKTLPGRYVANGVRNGKWGLAFPNCIDPCVFYDAAGKLWMSYGKLEARGGYNVRVFRSRRPDGTISGARTGRWSLDAGTPYITIAIDGVDTFRGVALTVAVDETNDKTPGFTAIGDKTQLTLWGARDTRRCNAIRSQVKLTQ